MGSSVRRRRHAPGRRPSYGRGRRSRSRAGRLPQPSRSRPMRSSRGAPRAARRGRRRASRRSHHETLGPVPAVDVGEERVARGAPHGVLGADDVPAERLVAVQMPLPDVADVAARGVGVHVHLLDDHALLTLDLVGVEARVAQHVDEHVERDVACLRGALHVVARELLPREGVELAADRVDLGRDVPCGRPALGALEEHVLGEVRDPAFLPLLVARAGGVHEEAGHRLRVRHPRRQDAGAVGERGALERRHATMLAAARRGEAA